MSIGSFDPSLFIAAGTGDTSAVWPIFLQLVLLLLVALCIGMLFERLGQSAILGYLLAGTIMGPAVLNIVDEESGVPILAELGVSMLLFAIGLEFSAKRLLQLGDIALIGGSIQVAATLLIVALVCMASGLSTPIALAVGATIALSSTACVLRVLTDRAELDSIHGRSALGILLLQDVAVVPLVLIVSMLGGSGSAGQMALAFLEGIGFIALMIGGFFLLSHFLLPRILKNLSFSRDRELLILLAVILALGSASVAHFLDISPALGAFIAGIMLAESPFATQIRADISALRSLFITLFFTSVGMLGDPVWIFHHALEVGLVVGVIVLGKAAIISMIAVALKRPLKHAIATGVSLAQVGEFGVVIAGIAHQDELIPDELFRLLVSSTLISLFATPLLVKSALFVGSGLASYFSGLNLHTSSPEPGESEESEKFRHRIFVVGFGPSGQCVADDLKKNGRDFIVLDLREPNIEMARTRGYRAELGDATNPELLLHHGITEASAVVITVPDHRAVCHIVSVVRDLSPSVGIIARARYHPFVADLEKAGATVVVDEEFVTGRRLASAARALISRFGD